MISEGSCETWKFMENFSFAITGINYILKYIKVILNCNNISQYYRLCTIFFKRSVTGDEQKSAKFSFQMVFTFFPFFNQQPAPYLAWTWTDWARRRLNAKKTQTKTSSEIWSEFTNLIWWHWAELWLTHTGGSNDDAGYRSRFLCHSLQHLYEPRQNVFIYLEKKHQGFS